MSSGDKTSERWSKVNDWKEGCRRCTKCEIEKLLEEFGKHKDCAKGHNPVCRECRKIKSKLDLSRQTQEYKIFHRAKTRAKKEDVPFDLELSDILIPPVCPVFGTKFVYGNTHLTASIDRLEPSLGYVKGNIHIISNRANRLKNDATIEELRLVLDYVERNIK